MNLYKHTLSIIFAVAFSFSLMGQEIAEDFPLESRFLSINGHKIHYVETGSGDPILFLHGIPMSSYAWRNVIPHLAKDARCIALDFMGFGKSDKPDIGYTFDDQYQYLSAFIDSLELKNVTIVMTDIGAILGQTYARNHPDNIKALVFMESPITDAVTFQKYGGMMQRMMFWMAGKDKLGYRMFVKKNMFIRMMPRLIKRKLSKDEKREYAAPFATERSRIPLFSLSNSYPRKGKNSQPGDMADYMNLNSEWLIKSKHPKLMLTARPGMLFNKKTIAWARDNLSSLKISNLGKAKHLMEEDLPHEIGIEILEWYKSL